MDAWTYDKIDEAVQILADIAYSLKRLADFYAPILSEGEPNSSEKPNNCVDEPQTNADQHVQRVEYVGNNEKSRCWTCKHFDRMHETPIASDGNYYTYVVCTAKECHYEPKDEPQIERSE